MFIVYVPAVSGIRTAAEAKVLRKNPGRKSIQPAAIHVVHMLGGLEYGWMTSPWTFQMFNK